MTNRERTRALTLGPRMMLFECTDHESFDQLRDQLQQILTAVTEVGHPSGIREVSLQYVDEIRHPSATTPHDWQRLVVPLAVGLTDLLDVGAQQTAGIAIYELSPHQQLKVNYAAVADGFAVNPNGPLRVAPSEGGPHFRLDLESQWSAPGDDAVPAFDVEPVLVIADELHTPISEAFEGLIQDRLREYFRGNETPDLSPAESSTALPYNADEPAVNVAYAKEIFYPISPTMLNLGDLGLQLLEPRGRFDCLGSPELSDLMARYAEEPIHGQFVFNAQEVERETAPTSKMPTDMIAQLSAMPPVVNSVKQFKVVDDLPSASEMIPWHIHGHWPKLSDEFAANYGAVLQKRYLPQLTLTEQLAAPSFGEQILTARATADSLRVIAQLRQLLAQAVSRYEHLDHTARLERLRETAAVLGKREPLDLLTSLADERGLSWHTISIMLGVSSSAVRKWRRGANVAPENREQIAALVAFFEQVDEIQEPIADVGSWMEMRVREDTMLTRPSSTPPGPGTVGCCFEWMRGYVDATAMLDRFYDSWRERYARDTNFHAVETEAGERAIVPR